MDFALAVSVNVTTDFANQIGSRREDAADDDVAFDVAYQISTWTRDVSLELPDEQGL